VAGGVGLRSRSGPLGAFASVLGDRFASGFPAPPEAAWAVVMERIVVTSPSRHRRAALWWGVRLGAGAI
jgi:hypothetical protein